MNNKLSRGYTLVELIVAVGLFAIIMTIASGSYLVMIGINRQVQGMASGINNLSFALETMTRTIRTGTNYSCNNIGDCSNGGTVFSVTNSNGRNITYTLDTSSGVITQTDGGVTFPLTELSVNVSSLRFYASGTARGDRHQSRVTIIVSGDVTYGPNKKEYFTVQTGATMRGTDI